MPEPPAVSSLPALPPAGRWMPLLERALEEDIGSGDVTSRITIPEHEPGEARIEARQALVVCGTPIVRAVFERVDPRIEVIDLADEGEAVEAGRVIGRIRGPMRSILTAERTALNFLGRLAGIATLTRRFVEAVAGTGARIVDTRKTLPGWRDLDKYAVAVGGGTNHRVGLYDGILLKDNHIAAAGGVEAAVKTAIARAPAHLRVQVEVEDEAQAEAALSAGAGFLLLDNMPPSRIRPLAERLRGRAVLEASGGVRLDNVRAYAEAGVQRISIGALTHSPPAADVALEVVCGGVAR